MKSLEEIVTEVVATFGQKSAQDQDPDLVALTYHAAKDNDLDATQIETLGPLINKAYLVSTGRDPVVPVTPAAIHAYSFPKSASVEEAYHYAEYSSDFNQSQKHDALVKSASSVAEGVGYQNGLHGYNAASMMKGKLAEDIYSYRNLYLSSKSASAECLAKSNDLVKVLKMYGVSPSVVMHHAKTASASPEVQVIIAKIFAETKQVKSASVASQSEVFNMSMDLVEATTQFVEHFKQTKFASEALELKKKQGVLLSQIGDVLIK